MASAPTLFPGVTGVQRLCRALLCNQWQVRRCSVRARLTHNIPGIAVKMVTWDHDG